MNPDERLRRDVRRSREDAKEATGNKVENAKDRLQEAAQDVGDKGHTFGEKVKDTLTDAKDKVAEVAENAWDKMPSLRKSEDVKDTKKPSKLDEAMCND